jgi:(1->4)-alpha-D-glucan 1-alpha-D-glucosylmutase
MRKAAREAKLRTSWVEPDAAYEAALDEFVAAVLEPRDDAPFLTDVARLVSRVAAMGAWNALSRIVVHLTSPGTPDVYQGDELWNFALVDPDNRRPVDYDQRVSMLEGDGLAGFGRLEERLHESRGALPDAHDSRLKLLVTQRLLEMRRTHGGLFAGGEYRRLEVHGARPDHVIAFARHAGGRHAITIAPRLVCTLLTSDPKEWWSGTTVEVPVGLRGRRWRSQIVPGEVVPPGDALELGDLLHTLPMAVLVS